MLEAVFGKSAAGVLAQSIGRKDSIFCFADDLSTGDISGDCLAESRRKSVLGLYSIFTEERKYLMENLEESKENLAELTARAAAGESIRIWYSEHPNEYCGMCWLINELSCRLNPLPEILLMCLPNQVEKEAVIRKYLGWSEVCPDVFPEFLPLERIASTSFAAQIKEQWNEMQAQNAPLRAFINGTLHSVPIDFYDSFIRREMECAEEEFHEAALIGKVIGKYQLGIGDMWVAIRIENMIENGELSPVSETKAGETIYRRMLKKQNRLRQR